MTKNVDTYICNLSRAPQPIQAHTVKFGGTPILMHPLEWPTCRHCAQKMTFLAQIPLQQPLHFSRKYAMAYVFMCPGKFDQRGWLECQTWLPFSGANVVVLQEYSSSTILIESVSEYPDYAATLEHVLEPPVDTSDYSIDEDEHLAVSELTKIGGVPLWLQANESPVCQNCSRSMQFVAQFAAELDGRLPAGPRKWDDEKYKFFHFGGNDGIGYLFICENECQAAFLWQCT